MKFIETNMCDGGALITFDLDEVTYMRQVSLSPVTSGSCGWTEIIFRNGKFICVRLEKYAEIRNLLMDRR